VQDPESLLDGAPRESGLLRDLAMREADPLAPRPDRLSPEEEIDEERGRAVVVTDEIAQEDVYDVVVDGERSHGRTISSNTIVLTNRLYSPRPVCQKSRRKEADAC
jgi:hypothetical protein